MSPTLTTKQRCAQQFASAKTQVKQRVNDAKRRPTNGQYRHSSLDISARCAERRTPAAKMHAHLYRWTKIRSPCVSTRLLRRIGHFETVETQGLRWCPHRLTTSSHPLASSTRRSSKCPGNAPTCCEHIFNGTRRTQIKAWHAA